MNGPVKEKRDQSTMNRTFATTGFLCLLLATWCLNTAAARDTIYLKSGRILHGKVTEGKAKKGGDFILLTTETGAVYKLDKGDIVKSILKREQADIDYAARLKHVRDIATDHIELAKWCQDQDRGKTRFKEQIRWHYENVIRLDPEHSNARKKLGYMKLSDGTWVAEAEFKSRQGYIPDRKRSWVSGMSKNVEQANEKVDEEFGAKKKAFNRWSNDARRGNVQPAALNAICDASTIIMVYEQAIEVTEAGNIELARVHLDAISTVKNQVAIRSIAQFAMAANSQELREHAIALLSQNDFSHATVVLTFREGLQSTNRWIVHNSAFAIAEVASADDNSRDHAILPLAEALITTHSQKIAGALESGRLNPSFGPGGASLTTGGGPQTREVDYRNQPTLDAMRRLYEVDFEYNEDKWREWYIENYTLSGLDVRVDN